ncbi:MAG: glycine cleavage system aminomethyltransferase GcvT, partial [Candidatus Bathyarchaeia archaeon]
MLHDYHRAHARLMEFASYEMPSEYRGVIHEHLSVRNSVGVFDVSHMARFLLEGRDAGRLLDHVASKACSTIEPLKAQYVLFCNPEGGIIDDLIIYRLTDERYMVVVNAGNRGKDLAWLNSNAAGYSVRLEDVTDRVSMFAVQGPNATHVLSEAVGERLEDIPRFGFHIKDHESVRLLISRTGYTGEDGFEIIPLAEFDISPYAHRLWETLVN